jgi:FtsP/CotA-like multicopper oxidase with cupredoxin domain
MRQPLLVALLLACLLAPAARAQATLRVVAHDDGPAGSHNEHGYWFTLDGVSGRNPVIPLAPGEVVAITFVNEGSRNHTLNVSGEADSGLVAPNASVTFDVALPATASGGAYWCDLHRAIGMGGELSVAGVAGPFDGQETRAGLVPAAPLGLALAALGLAALAWRRRA